MAKGADAKIYVANKIKEAFGSDYVGEYDKKYYVWGYENGEKVQICISMTCPKTPIGDVSESGSSVGEKMDFEDMVVPQEYTKAEITENETKTIQEMMKRLGL